VLELGTIEGARSMGIADKVGSLKAGKRADLIMVSDARRQSWHFHRSGTHARDAAQPSNVIRGDRRPHSQRGGKLTALNVSQIVGEASAANAALRKRRGVVVSGGWQN